MVYIGEQNLNCLAVLIKVNDLSSGETFIQS